MRLNAYSCLIVLATLSLGGLARAAQPEARSWESRFDFGGEFGGSPAAAQAPDASGGLSWSGQYDFGGEFVGARTAFPEPSASARPSDSRSVAAWSSRYDFGGEFGGERAAVSSRDASAGRHPAGC